MSAAPSRHLSSTQSPALQTSLDRVAAFGVILETPDEVSDYLARHPDLLDLLPNLSERTRQQFPDGELLLTVHHDPEFDDPYLKLYVRVWPYPGDMDAQLDAVWGSFEDALSSGSGWIILSTDYRKPGSSRGRV